MSPERAEALDRLAAAIRGRGLTTPASLLLEALAPVDLIASQLAQASRPLLGGTRLDPYAAALADVAAWAELRARLEGN